MKAQQIRTLTAADGTYDIFMDDTFSAVMGAVSLMAKSHGRDKFDADYLAGMMREDVEDEEPEELMEMYERFIGSRYGLSLPVPHKIIWGAAVCEIFAIMAEDDEEKTREYVDDVQDIYLSTSLTSLIREGNAARMSYDNTLADTLSLVALSYIPEGKPVSECQEEYLAHGKYADHLIRMDEVAKILTNPEGEGSEEKKKEEIGLLIDLVDERVHGVPRHLGSENDSEKDGDAGTGNEKGDEKGDEMGDEMGDETGDEALATGVSPSNASCPGLDPVPCDVGSVDVKGEEMARAGDEERGKEEGKDDDDDGSDVYKVSDLQNRVYVYEKHHGIF